MTPAFNSSVIARVFIFLFFYLFFIFCFLSLHDWELGVHGPVSRDRIRCPYYSKRRG